LLLIAAASVAFVVLQVARQRRMQVDANA